MPLSCSAFLSDDFQTFTSSEQGPLHSDSAHTEVTCPCFGLFLLCPRWVRAPPSQPWKGLPVLSHVTGRLPLLGVHRWLPQLCSDPQHLRGAQVKPQPCPCAALPGGTCQAFARGARGALTARPGAAGAGAAGAGAEAAGAGAVGAGAAWPGAAWPGAAGAGAAGAGAAGAGAAVPVSSAGALAGACCSLRT